jgi:hypothetical protein
MRHMKGVLTVVERTLDAEAGATGLEEITKLIIVGEQYSWRQDA